MSKKKKMVPQLRFPGFSGEWEERKLSELATFSKGIGYSKADLTKIGKPIILYGRLYTKYETVISEVDTFVSDNSGAVLSEGNEVIVPASGETAEDIARAAVVDKKGIVLGGDLNIIRPKSEIDQTFLALNISNGGQQKEMMKRAQGKSIVHLHNSDLKEVLLKYPSLEEQLKIGKFFNKFDHLITLQQRKLSHLQTRKKGLLQKMFPKDGEQFPELRFPGFTDAWEVRQLSEVAEQTFGGGTPKTLVDEYWSGEIPWIQSSDLTDGKVYGVVPNKTISEVGLNNSATKLVPANSIAIVTRVGVGKLSFMPFSYATSQDFLSLSSLNIDPWFCVYSCYKKFQSELHAVQGTSIKGITKDELLAKIISVPTIEEQAKIGAFFKQLDDSITLHQRKLDHLQTRKKALLQQMFV